MADVPIYGPIRAMTSEGKSAYASQVWDAALGMFQSEINGTFLDAAYETVQVGNLGDFTGDTSSTGYYPVDYYDDLYNDLVAIWNSGKIPVLIAGLSNHNDTCVFPVVPLWNSSFLGIGKAEHGGNYIVRAEITSTQSRIYTEGTYTKPSGGIPKSDLAPAVQQEISEKEVTSNKTSLISSNKTSTTKYPTTKGVADYAEAKMFIVSSSGTSLTASVDNYYRFDSAVNTLAVTLSTPSDTTHITKAVFMFTTGATPAVTFAGATGVNVIAQDGFSIEATTTYEINAIYNGAAWVIAAMKLDTTPINS